MFIYKDHYYPNMTSVQQEYEEHHIGQFKLPSSEAR